MTPKGQSQKDARMRREGYDDGYALLRPKRLDAEYQRAWRRGWMARKDRARRVMDTDYPRSPEAS